MEERKEDVKLLKKYIISIEIENSRLFHVWAENSGAAEKIIKNDEWLINDLKYDIEVNVDSNSGGNGKDGVIYKEEWFYDNPFMYKDTLIFVTDDISIAAQKDVKLQDTYLYKQWLEKKGQMRLID